MFQDVSLSPLIVCITLKSLTNELNEPEYGYQIDVKKRSNLVLMNDLKCYGKINNEFEGLLRTINAFSDGK